MNTKTSILLFLFLAAVRPLLSDPIYSNLGGSVYASIASGEDYSDGSLGWEGETSIQWQGISSSVVFSIGDLGWSAHTDAQVSDGTSAGSVVYFWFTLSQATSFTFSSSASVQNADPYFSGLLQSVEGGGAMWVLEPDSPIEDTLDAGTYYFEARSAITGWHDGGALSSDWSLDFPTSSALQGERLYGPSYSVPDGSCFLAFAGVLGLILCHGRRS